MDSTASDADLLAATSAGDLGAFELLAERHHGLVRSACLRQGMRAELDDCVQAVFLVLLRKADQARRAPALAPWLLTVARHVCATARRGAAARRRAEQEAAMRTATVLPATAPDAAAEHLDDCLARLPERQRAVIALHYLAGATRDEVASRLGIEVDTVHQLCRRGLEGLRTLLRRRGVAVPAAGVLALLASQAQAASAAPPFIAATTAAGTPAAAYATGATAAMTIATIAPLGLVAATLLTIAGGVTIGLVSAEPDVVKPPPIATTPPAVLAPPAPSAADAAFAARVAVALAQEVTLDFQDHDVADVLNFIHRITGLTVIVAPEVAAGGLPPVTLRVESMRLDHVLIWIERLTGTRHRLQNEALFVTTGVPDELPARPADAVWRAAIEAKLAQRVTFDFQETPFHDVVSFVRQISGINILEMESPEAQKAAVSLKVNDMRLTDALKWLCELAGGGGRFEIMDEAVVIRVGERPAPGGPRTAPPAPRRDAPATKPPRTSGTQDF